MKTLIVADPLESLHHQSDTSLAMAREALRQGWEVFYATKEQLWLKGSEPMVTAREMESTATLAEPSNCYSVNHFKVVLMRYDPPFDMAYYSATRILAMAKCLVVNEPKAVLLEPEKILPFEVAEGKFCPPSIITADAHKLKKFQQTHSKIVLKPLYGNGGKGIVTVTTEQELEAKLQELLTPNISPFIPPPIPIVAQRLLPEVTTKGDKRCFIIGGKFKGGFARIPKRGSILANLAQGGSAQRCQFSKTETLICNEVAKLLSQRKILFAGVDLIAERLIEINITSPTGFCDHKELYGEALEIDLWQAIGAVL